MSWRQTAAVTGYGEEEAAPATKRLPATRAPRTSSTGRVAAAIAHEIRTPLAVALMYLRLVEQEAGPNMKGSLREGLTLARAEVARLDRLLTNLVDLHRLGHAVIRPALVDAGRIASEAVRSTVGDLSVGQVTIEISGADLLDWWDPSAIEQIIQHLVSNAVQYGLGRPISVKVDRHQGQLRLRVCDNGGGPAAGARARVFSRRLGPRTARTGGMGMSLWLVRELAEAHGGSAALEFDKGVGSTFTITLAPGRPPE
jgi:signal transduction histidine kinase